MKLDEWRQLGKMQDERDAAIVEIGRLKLELRAVTQDLELLARRACRTGEFYDWLMCQDNSATLMDNCRPYGGISVEGRTDVQLALKWAEGRTT